MYPNAASGIPEPELEEELELELELEDELEDELSVGPEVVVPESPPHAVNPSASNAKPPYNKNLCVFK